MIRAAKKRIDWNVIKAKLRAAETALEQSSFVDEARLQKLFHKRAERLAACTRVQSTAATTPVLVFRVGDETLGVELRCVAQVFPDTPITPVPGAPETLLGVANLQGEVRSVFGLRRLFAMPDGDDETNRYILLLRRDSSRVGLQIEHVDGVRHLELDDLDEHDDASADERGSHVSGMTHDKVIMLRMDRLFEY